MPASKYIRKHIASCVPQREKPRTDACSPPMDPEKISYHEVKTDAQGKLIPWYGSGPSQAYDHVIRLVWDFWRGMKPCSNGVAYYLQHQVWRPKEDPRGLGGDQISMALSSWALLYNYTAIPRLVDNMRFMADYWLAHGLSKSD